MWERGPRIWGAPFPSWDVARALCGASGPANPSGPVGSFLLAAWTTLFPLSTPVLQGALPCPPCPLYLFYRDPYHSLGSWSGSHHLHLLLGQVGGSSWHRAQATSRGADGWHQSALGKPMRVVAGPRRAVQTRHVGVRAPWAEASVPDCTA